MSVKDLVEKAKKDEETFRVKEKERKLKAKKQIDFKDFEIGISRLISSFESNVFNLNSSEKKVAQTVLEDKGVYLHINKDHVWKIWHNDDKKDYSLGTYKKYQDWKKTLEDKFEVDIYIDTHYTYTNRYSNSGYLVGTDDHFQGIKAYVSLKK